jgi:predicted ATPase
MKIVLTGGPRAGKSTVLEFLKTSLPNDGYNVVVVPELATLKFGSGINVQKILTNSFKNKQFQMDMIREQLTWEASFQQLARLATAPDSTILICDRGTIDNLAYLRDVDKQMVLNSCYVTHDVLKRGYDAIIHMETSAVASDYDLKMVDNTARQERESTHALTMDRLILEEWKKGTTTVPHFTVGYSDEFDVKMNTVKEIILSLIPRVL